MDMYGVTSGAECFPIDELLDFSNDELFSSSAASSSTDSDPFYLHPPQFQNPPSTSTSASASASAHFRSFQPINYGPTTTDFTNDLCLPSDDVAELEWLSRFVDDSFNDFPANEIDGAFTYRSDTSFSGSRARTKRSKELTTTWTSSPDSESQETGKSKQKSKHDGFGDRGSAATEGGARRCTHCASERTPQWRTGPLGPKTLCNACGVRYKSGRLVPEYRPASSPTFVLTQHSNSHRKVLELRRQKELMS